MITYRTYKELFIITINDPQKLNSLTFDDFIYIASLLEKADHDENVVVTVIQSSGKFFSAGGKFDDINTLAKENEEQPQEKRVGKLVKEIAAPNVYVANVFTTHRKILVCCLNGPAVGLSACLVLLCDIVYVMNESVYLLFPFSSLGFVAELGSSVTLPWKVGLNRANDHLFFSTPLTFDEMNDCDMIAKDFSMQAGETDQFNAKVVDYVVENIRGNGISTSSMLGMKQLLVQMQPQHHNWLLKSQGVETNTTLPFWLSGEPFKRFRQLQLGHRRHKM